MNLKPTIIALAFMLFSISVFGQYNYIQKLGNLATIALPDTPNIFEKEETKIYRVIDHGVIFWGGTGDVSGGLIDHFRKSNLNSIYDSYINGTLGSQKGKLFYKNKIDINGQEGLEFGYKAQLNGQQTFRYNQIVLLNDTLVMSGILASDLLSKDDKNLALFFSGFKIKSKEQLSEDRAADLGHKTGKILAILILISIPILLGFGIIFIIKKIMYRKKNKPDAYKHLDT